MGDASSWRGVHLLARTGAGDFTPFFLRPATERVYMTRRTVLLFATTLLAVLLVSSTAWAVLVKAADWQMNETSAGQMLDSSGNNNHGTPSTTVLRTGSTYVFDGSTSHVVVPDADTLDPGAADITLRASVKVNGDSLDDDSYDVVRKGLSATPGGDYKMEIKRASDPRVGKLHCLFKGTGGRVNKVARPDVVDGSWHTLECAKTGNSVVARVDGGSFTKTGSAGSISNASNVMVGAKTANPFDDVFDGSMDFVSIEIAQ
jgi:hypothetical protein